MISFWREIEKLKNKVIIVEGIKDKQALKNLGLKKIVPLKGPIYKFCEDFSKKYKEAVILTDLDLEGKKLYSKIKNNLHRNGVKTDDKFRQFLFKETKLTQIEGVVHYIKKVDIA